MRATLVYVYCLVSSRRPPAMEDAPKGLPGAKPPRAVSAGSALWLVVADVPDARYNAETVEAGLDDLKWVGRCAMAHEAVVEHFVKAPAVVPMKLFTIFQSEARALEEIASARPTIDDAVERLSGAAEWGVRLTRQVRPAATARGAKAPATGTSFLQQKRKLRDESQAARQRGLVAADRVFTALSRLARESRRRDAQSLAAGPGVVLDAAFLVARKDTRRFQHTVSTLARAAAADDQSLTITGPWPPYNFIDAQAGARRRSQRRAASQPARPGVARTRRA